MQHTQRGNQFEKENESENEVKTETAEPIDLHKKTSKYLLM